MGQHLLLTVRVHGDDQGTGRFHGTAQGAPEWPPAPARLFQALVAGVARGSRIPDEVVDAFEWLEHLPPPIIAAPRRKLGQSVALFVPNNDADAVPDPRDISSIRTKKLVQPSLFAGEVPFHYAWPVPGDERHAATIVRVAERLYQLGRGVDMAWATGAMLDDEALQSLLERYAGVIHHPEPGVSGERMLACPVSGSLDSLVLRHGAPKLRVEGTGRKVRVLFTNAPKPRFLSVAYDRARRQAIFELRDRSQDKPWPWALGQVVSLVERLRDGAATRLRDALPDKEHAIDRCLIGRRPDGTGSGPTAERVRVIPLPSIGSEHADRGIRRVLVDVPSGAPLSAGDVEWAFAGLEWKQQGTGEPSPLIVTRSDDDRMLRHYAGPSRRWRSVTAVALPESARRRRIDPNRQREEAKAASERRAEEERAVAATHAALRHAGVRATAIAVRAQREPFEGKGARAEGFAEGTRFPKERLWHLEVELDRPVSGPLVLGDGRFLGLGLMAPAAAASAVSAMPRRPPGGKRGLWAFAVLGHAEDAPLELARALRRAVMACAQRELPGKPLDRYFSGHEADRTKAIADEANHLAFHWDRQSQRLLVIAPHLLDRRDANNDERRHLRTLERALDDLSELRAGRAGRFGLRRVSLDPADPLLAPSVSWTSLTPYVVTRHRKRSSASAVIIEDIRLECDRRHLPRPQVTVRSARGVSGSGLQAEVQLDFAAAVAGPIALGRT
ncbi:MAG TPA: type I-U CRISPR-associated protein Csb2, partial [Polyangiaceae bacterium]|nr:type I-U CRISPR-associated protein Csb2 [Polyangiaceae bacterium]